MPSWYGFGTWGRIWQMTTAVYWTSTTALVVLTSHCLTVAYHAFSVWNALTSSVHRVTPKHFQASHQESGRILSSGLLLLKFFVPAIFLFRIFYDCI